MAWSLVLRIRGMVRVQFEFAQHELSIATSPGSSLNKLDNATQHIGAVLLTFMVNCALCFQGRTKRQWLSVTSMFASCARLHRSAAALHAKASVRKNPVSVARRMVSI